MDNDVIAALQRWPNVPAAYGWLRLDRRGHWHMIDRNVPGFDEQRDGLGSMVRNERLIEFIGRNYLCDDSGNWFFQNGPQRAFVNLDLAPLVWRIDDGQQSLKWISHIGGVALQTLEAAQDTQGNIFIRTELGVGVVDDRHLGRLSAWLTSPTQPSSSVSLSWGSNTLPVALVEQPGLHFGFATKPTP